MIRIDLIRRELDKTMLDTVTTAFESVGLLFQWTGVNTSLVLDNAKVHVISGLLPNTASSAELGAEGALSIRKGVYIVTFSMPEKMPVDDVWLVAARLEERLRRKRLTTDAGSFWCDEPYSENNGKDGEGRYLISTTVPWTAVTC